ncbi:glycine/betaine ABC transporter [Acidithiobacillus marinus]|uniref:Glycine/betaine ABC transporter n=1 Tax=Acidithiobacillus marinus TaxID=187490 RepID=A0A2I1DNR2_9PROT|nr:proline/glycine betaine ABC transporter permease [Acidithiobacillus marinus]PKY11499.1 glycine/betaine ABC transporter [Acidithiobacillus marinus]
MYHFPEIPLGHWVSTWVNNLTANYSDSFDAISSGIHTLIAGLNEALLAIPPEVFILLVAVMALFSAGWRRPRAWGLVLFCIVGLGLVWNLNLWSALIQTLALVLAAEILVLIIGLPAGILTAESVWAARILRPVLDIMQTMPAFVYLVPAVIFFGLGLVPGVIATTIFALPPLVRLTSLGIQNVPEELIEASEAFGATWFQRLWKVQLPTALPSIMAGVNQSIMLGLSMVVIAAMIGAGGLGNQVLQGITQLDVGESFVGGISVVILAIIIDRLTQSLAKLHKE